MILGVADYTRRVRTKWEKSPGPKGRREIRAYFILSLDGGIAIARGLGFISIPQTSTCLRRPQAWLDIPVQPSHRGFRCLGRGPVCEPEEAPIRFDFAQDRLSTGCQ